MITTETIEKIRNVAPSQVIQKYMDLKKKGANYQGCCPFHGEKTPSFMVNDEKGIYKCFGCGVAGDGIKFVMELESKSFGEACRIVADIDGITMVEDVKEYTQAQKESITAAEEQEQVLNFVIPVYRRKLLQLPADHPVMVWLTDRKLDSDLINEWDLGWAGDDWHHITPQIINKGLYEVASKLGVVKRSKEGENNFDGYRSRITFPIRDKNGRYIGMGGRFISLSPSDSKDTPKYINPSECELYNKSVVLYGLPQAAKYIKEVDYVNIVEGYMDVVSPHRIGFKNTVATCGTAFTDAQMRLLKRHTNHIVMWRDNDKAGENSFIKSLPELLKNGFKVSFMKYEGKDPDDFIQNIDKLNEANGFKFPNFVDAVMYRILQLWNDVEGIHEKAEAKRAILELISSIGNEILRNNYLDEISKFFKWKASETRKQFADIVEAVNNQSQDDLDAEGAVKLPEWLSQEDKDNFLERGYVTVDRKINGKIIVGYYGFNPSGKFQITNFKIIPLFHVLAGVESRFIVQVNNGHTSAVLDMPARTIISPDQFSSWAVTAGCYIIYGNKNQWLRIVETLLHEFIKCIEINNLGWQSFGFFAYVDKIHIPGYGLKDLDNWGIVKHENEHFLIPASCEAYRDLQRTGEDPYENDRYLTYKESPISFSTWALQMQAVYLEKGVVAVAYVVLTVFRDIIFAIDNNCPHLYAFGEPSSGKSKFAESITAVFYHGRSAFNLNSGTDFAFFNYMQRYNNAPAHLNEFDIEVIKPEWFQAIKGIYDGEGRERGKGGSKNRTEVMRVRSTLVLTGQKLVTADDNSVVTRSIIEPFGTRDDISEEEKSKYNKIKDWEKKGLSSMLIELLVLRSEFESSYQDNYNEQLSTWRKENTGAAQVNQRILQNFSHLATCYKLVSKHIQLPQTEAAFTKYCLKQALKWSQFIRSSDTLSEFWHTMEFLIDQQQLHEGWDYKIESLNSLKVRVNRNEEKDHQFTEPTKVLFIRLNTIHKHYQSAYRSRTGKEAMNKDNLLHYFSSRKYFIGAVKAKPFKRFIYVTDNIKNSGPVSGSHVATEKKEQAQLSSCYAFLYEDLGIEIEKITDPEAIQTVMWKAAKMEEFENNDLPFG